MSTNVHSVSNPPVHKPQLTKARSLDVLRRGTGIVVIFALSVCMLIVWAHFARVIISSYSPLPYWDYWDTVKQIDHYRHFDISVLWQQHNEHRIVFPELIFASDYIFFQGREILPAALSAFFYFGTWLIFSAVAYRDNLPWFVRLCAIPLAGIVMGWEGGALQIGSPFLIQWSLMLAAAALALFLLTQVPVSSHPGAYLVCAIACAAISTYSSASALFFWPVILLSAWILRLTKFQLTILATSAVVLIGLYFVGYRFSHDSNPATLLSHPFYAISFIAAYLGMPFTAIGPTFGLCAGFLELAAYLVFIGLAARRRSLNTSPGVVLLGFYLFCLLTAALTATGRMNPLDPNFGAATAHRYVMVPLAAHGALILAGAWLLGNSRFYLWVPFLAVFALAFARMERSTEIGFWRDLAKDSISHCQVASVAFESGIDDSGLMSTVFPGPDYVRQMLPILRATHLSIFASRRSDWLGRPASSVFHFVSGEPEFGANTGVYPLQSGLMVLGWTDSPRKIWHPQELVFLDDQKRIVGFGRKLPGGLPHGLASFETPQSLAWVGFVNLSFRSKSFSSYVIEARGKALVPIGKPIAIPAVRPLRADQVGAPISTMHWETQGGWRKNGLFPAVPAGMPPAISYYESWNGGDANTGLLTSAPFERPPGNCIIMAGAHGPSAGGLSEKVINPDTNEMIASVPFVGRDVTWHFWGIDLPPNAQHLQIIAEDRGHGWGEWLAIGDPHLCK
jgi:hypothetical protein